MIRLQGINYYTVVDIIKNLSISRQTLWRWRSERKVPLGRKYRNRQLIFTQSEYEAIMEFANRIEPLVETKDQLALFHLGRNE